MKRALEEYVSHAPVFVRTLEGRIVHWTQGAEELYGFPRAEAEGRCSHELLKTEFPGPPARINDALRATGEWCGRLRHRTRDGHNLYVLSSWRLREEPGRPGVVVETNTDITARVEAERHRELLTQELNHRVKNTLAIVQALARLTFNGAETECVRRFEARLLALSEAHNLLVREHWEHANLKDVVCGVANYLNVQDRLSIDGPDLQLRPSAAVSYTLAMHELCTNALKHGALSKPGGRVEVTWEVEDREESKIHLLWREIGGPPVAPPTRKGFGSKLIQRAVSTELGTPVSMRFEPTGLICEFDGPVQKSPSATPMQPSLFG